VACMKWTASARSYWRSSSRRPSSFPSLEGVGARDESWHTGSVERNAHGFCDLLLRGRLLASDRRERLHTGRVPKHHIPQHAHERLDLRWQRSVLTDKLLRGAHLL